MMSDNMHKHFVKLKSTNWRHNVKIIHSKSFAKLAAKRSSWKDVPGWLGIELGYDQASGQIKDLTFGKPLSGTILDELKSRFKISNDYLYELIIHFVSSGYRDAGSMYGGEDQLGWAPEHEDERIITSVDVNVDGGKVGTLSKPATDAIDYLYWKEIEENGYMPDPESYDEPPEDDERTELLRRRTSI